MASETQSNEPETQLVEDEAPLELKDRLGTSLIPEQDVCVADKQEDQRSVSSLESQGQQARPRTRKAVSASLENLRKKRNRAGEAVKARISHIDQLLLEQCTDIVKLTASKDGLNMDMDNLKRLHNEISDLSMLNSDDEFPNEDHEYFDRICNNYLDCCADVKTKINDLTQERFEMLTQRSHKSSGKSSISKLFKVSSMSSRQAAANAAGLKQRMTSLIRQQELERKKEELQLVQRELERQGEQERLQGEIKAVVAIHDTLVDHPSIPPSTHDHPSIPTHTHDYPSISPPIHDHPSIPPSNHDHPSIPTHTHDYPSISPPIHDHPSIPHLTMITQVYPHLTMITRVYPHIPMITQVYPHLSMITQVYPHLTMITRVYPHIPMITQVYPHLPTITQVHLHLAKITQVHPHPQPTSTSKPIKNCYQSIQILYNRVLIIKTEVLVKQVKLILKKIQTLVVLPHSCESSNEGKAEQRRTRNPVQPEVHTRFGGRNGFSGAIYRETSSETSL